MNPSIYRFLRCSFSGFGGKYKCIVISITCTIRPGSHQSEATRTLVTAITWSHVNATLTLAYVW